MMKNPTFAPGSAGLGEISFRRGFAGIETPLGWMPLPVAGAAYGTMAALDTLATLTNTTVADFGEDKVAAEIDAALAAHSRIEMELLGSFVEPTTDRLRRYGSQDAMTMDELDEFGRADAQKISAGATVGFPLRLYGISLQWTRKFLQNAMVSELAMQTAGAMDADSKVIQREIKRALFNPTNATVLDRLVDNVSLAIKRLLNADGASIPLGPNGEAFVGASHTHYLFTAGAAVVAADVNGLIETVIEHHPSGQALIYINRAQEAVMRTLAGFTAYLDARVINQTAGVVAGRSLDSFNVNDRAIGVYSAAGVSAEIHVKPWIPAAYLYAWVSGAPAPLVMRTRNAGGGNLEMVADDEAHPLRARSFERECGFSVWTRSNGAILFVDAGSGGAYVSPTIT